MHDSGSYELYSWAKMDSKNTTTINSILLKIAFNSKIILVQKCVRYVFKSIKTVTENYATLCATEFPKFQKNNMQSKLLVAS